MAEFEYQGIKIHFEERGQKKNPVIFWAHGWGQDHKAFLTIAESLTQSGRHILIDLPGFGASSPPHEIWSTADYADSMAALAAQLQASKIIWVGHSFGCRVGLQIAARHKGLIAGLFLIAAAGLPPKRPLLKKISIKSRIMLFKSLKRLIPLGLNREWLYKIFASPDYAKAGAMRQIFVKTVNEDLTSLLPDIQCPVQLIFGRRDFETPVEIGQRMNKNIKNSELIILEDQDHYTLLSEGRHPVVRKLKNFIEENA